MDELGVPIFSCLKTGRYMLPGTVNGPDDIILLTAITPAQACQMTSLNLDGTCDCRFYIFEMTRGAVTRDGSRIRVRSLRDLHNDCHGSLVHVPAHGSQYCR